MKAKFLMCNQKTDGQPAQSTTQDQKLKRNNDKKIKQDIKSAVNKCDISSSSSRNVQGDPLSRKPGNVREFDSCQGNVRDLTKSQGNVREKIL